MRTDLYALAGHVQARGRRYCNGRMRCGVCGSGRDAPRQLGRWPEPCGSCSGEIPYPIQVSETIVACGALGPAWTAAEADLDTYHLYILYTLMNATGIVIL